MPYAPADRLYYDADSHIMELPDFLKRYADPALRDAIPEVSYSASIVTDEEVAVIMAQGGRHSPEHVAAQVAMGDALIARLQVAALRVALQDRAMLDAPEHPVWQLMNRLASAATAWPAAGDRRLAGLNTDDVRALAQAAQRWQLPPEALQLHPGEVLVATQPER